MIISGYGYHSRIVSSKLNLRKRRIPSTLTSLFLYAGSQSAVGRHSASDCNLLDSGLLGGLDKLVLKYVYQRLLE